MDSAYDQDLSQGSVLGTDEDPAYKQTQKIGAIAPITGDGHAAETGQRLSGYATLDPNELPSQSTHSHHHHHHHHGHHVSKSLTSSPHVDRAERGEDGSREHRHKKKVRVDVVIKKKRKHEHEHEHGHHEGEGDSEHRKKKKRKREREEHGDIDIV
ncbi:hypothetical protein BGZ51_008315 [Haplosporangium sp. Z 767]|nr:hypothetical protein BGZ51_008315 [Haplosporangium sp. Z 767]